MPVNSPPSAPSLDREKLAKVLWDTNGSVWTWESLRDSKGDYLKKADAIIAYMKEEKG